MIMGSEPPSSSVTRLEPGAASAATRSPVGVEPVKATLRTSGCVTSASPATGPVPVTTFSTPGGSPASVRISARRSVVNGVVSAGLATTGVPAQERRPELVAQQRRREVPRDDRRDDPERPADDPPVHAGVEPVDGDPADLLLHPRVVLERVRRLAQLDPRLPQRLALLATRTGTSSSTCARKASAHAWRISPRSE
jgi:hypothetical protein